VVYRVVYTGCTTRVVYMPGYTRETPHLALPGVLTGVTHSLFTPASKLTFATRSGGLEGALK